MTQIKKMKNKLTPVLLTLLLIVQMFLPVQVFLDPPRVEIQEASAAGENWELGYSYRKEITINHGQVSGSSDLLNFPILINIISDDDLRTTSNGGDVTDSEGDDIIFTDENGNTDLDHEVERYNASTGELVAHVRIPILDHDDDTIIYLYYGNSAVTTSQENITGVWDSGYEMVQHLDETAKTDGAYNDHLDSTSKNNAEAEGGTAMDAVGKINGADSFDGTNDYLNIADSATLDITSAITIEAWMSSSADKWKYKKPISVTNTGSALSDHQISISVAKEAGMQANYQDLRFFDSSGNSLNYWIKDNTADPATIWVKVPSIPTWDGTGECPNANTIYVYYGNSTASSESDIGAVFSYSSYDFLTGAGTDKLAYRDQVGDNPGAGDPNTEFDAVASEYTNIHFDDDIYTSHTTPGIGFYAAHRFNFGINSGEEPWITMINITWNGKGRHYMEGDYDGVTLYIWNGTEYEILDSDLSTVDEVALIGERTSNISNYINSNNVTILAKQKSKSNFLGGGPCLSIIETDYVKLETWYREQDSPEPTAMVGNETATGISKAGSYGIGANTTTAFASINNQTITGGILLAGWNHVTMTYNKDAGSNQIKLFVNGTLVTQGALTDPISTNAKNLWIGDLIGFNGVADELRISAVARSADWIATCYNNQNSPAAFYTLGGEEIPLASPASVTQLKNDGSTVISNQGYTNETNVNLKASVTDANSSEVITLFFEAALSSGSFNSPATPTTGTSCASETGWSSCTDKIWYVTSASGDYTATPYTGTTNVAGLSDTVAYKWQVKACDDGNACSSWVPYNATVPNFTVDTTAPASVNAPTFGTVTASSIIINKPTEAVEEGSGLYQWQARRDNITELGFNAIAVASVTDAGLSENTQYVYDTQFNDNAGNASVYGTQANKYTLADTPTNLAGTAEQTSITLSADAFLNHASDSSGYYFANTTNSTNSGWIQTNTWQDTGLTCNTSYAYTVKYRNGEEVETGTISLNKTTANCSSGGGAPPSSQNPPSQPEPTPENPENSFSVIINNNDEYTNNQTVTLKLNAGSDTTGMAISNSSDFKYASIVSYQKEIEWDLSSRDEALPRLYGGEYIVYAKFYTQYGVASEVVSDSIILKTETNDQDNPETPDQPDQPETQEPETPEPETSPNPDNPQDPDLTNPTPTFTQTLQLNSNNSQVTNLQNKLKELNFFPQEIESNGNFGSITKQAVIDYQESRGIYPCGIIGPRTRKALNNEEFITNKDYVFTQDLKYNDKNEEVKQLQTRLRDTNFFPYYINSTGWFGPITEKAVKLFQSFYELVENGVVGEEVRGMLNGNN